MINEQLPLSELTANQTDFSFSDFSGANLSYANFSDCNLENGILAAANLQCATLTDCNLLDIEWHDAVLRELDLRGAMFNTINPKTLDLKDVVISPLQVEMLSEHLGLIIQFD
jgi:uncharacterized protein YjbI with pentapeptide repeats